MSDVVRGLSIGEVAERTGLSVHTLRFYEREGLLANAVQRDPGGRRVYSEDDVGWLTVCVILRGSGMPLPVIRHYTELVRAGGGTEAERLILLREHRERVLGQMDQLRKCLDLINFKVGVYEDALDQQGVFSAVDTTPAVDPRLTGVRYRDRRG
ncbi:MerR family transcriptional regulator [Micromonospora sp. NPDC000089]|uniref:MerR family transcriptional regulator n=1 Tax=unclassified Micromonospora TaxID=2617518 RepID=UPI00368D3714